MLITSFDFTVYLKVMHFVLELKLMIAAAEGKLMLLRHSQTKGHGGVRVHGGRSDIELSDEGIAAAERNAQQVAEYPIVALWSSPRRRAVRTAEPIARHFGLEIHQNPLFIERDFGALEDDALTEEQSLKARELMFRNWHREPNKRLMSSIAPRYEIDRDLLIRQSVAINALPETHPDEVTAVMGHWDWISTLLLHQTNEFHAPGNNGFAVINRKDFSVEELVNFELRRKHPSYS